MAGKFTKFKILGFVYSRSVLLLHNQNLYLHNALILNLSYSNVLTNCFRFNFFFSSIFFTHDILYHNIFKIFNLNFFYQKIKKLNSNI